MVRTASGLTVIAEIGLHGTVHLDGERVAVAVLGVAGGHAHPALADAIFLDIGLLDTFEADADVARQNRLVVVRAFRIDRQTVGEFITHGILLVHNRASISFFSPSGVAVGAWRATTLPERSTRNLVKFHLMEE